MLTSSFGLFIFIANYLFDKSANEKVQEIIKTKWKEYKKAKLAKKLAKLTQKTAITI